MRGARCEVRGGRWEVEAEAELELELELEAEAEVEVELEIEIEVEVRSATCRWPAFAPVAATSASKVCGAASTSSARRLARSVAAAA